LLKTIANENDINNLPTDAQISGKKINDSKVPADYQKNKIITARDNRKFELFKANFEAGGASGLDDTQIAA
jgi:hypothetical protein